MAPPPAAARLHQRAPATSSCDSAACDRATLRRTCTDRAPRRSRLACSAASSSRGAMPLRTSPCARVRSDSANSKSAACARCARAPPAPPSAAFARARRLGARPVVEQRRSRSAGTREHGLAGHDRIARLQLDAPHAPGQRRRDDVAIAHARPRLLLDRHLQRAAAPPSRNRPDEAPAERPDEERGTTRSGRRRSPLRSSSIRLQACRSVGPLTPASSTRHEIQVIQPAADREADSVAATSTALAA